jgi:REP element-mobilizing transposase RayT
MPAPIYTVENCRAAYQLNWSLSLFWCAPAPPSDQWFAQLQQAAEIDGVRVLEHRAKSAGVAQFLVSTRPETTPPQIVRSVKGRLQHLVRDDAPKAFRRNYSLHSIGSANRKVVEAYVKSQLSHHVVGDPRVQEMLEHFQFHDPAVDLSLPQRSSHGEYHYNLHLVLVNDGRRNEFRDSSLAAVREMLIKSAGKKRHRLANAGILADHIHLLIGCCWTESPLEVALGYLNNLAYAQ